MAWDYLSFAIVALIFTWICKKLLDNKDSLESLGIPHLKALPIIGHAWPIITKKVNFIEFGDEMYEKMAEGQIYGFYSFFGDYTLILSDPDLIKQISIKDFDYFVNRDRVDPNKIDKYLGKSLLMLRDQKWKEMRSNLTPVFTSSKMKSMFGLLKDCADEFVNFYKEKAANSLGRVTVDTHEVFTRVTADGIATTALGMEGDCIKNKNSEIFKMAEAIEEDFSNPRTLIFLNLFPKLFKLLGVQLFRKEIHDFFQLNILSEIRRRREQNFHRPDVIQLLIQAQDGKLKNDDKENSFLDSKIQKISHWTDDDLIAQALAFFLGGFETTAVLMQACFWELAMNPEVQQKLIDEIDEVLEELDGKKISYEKLNEMKYLDMVINETLRKWPSFRLTSRLCSKDYVLKLKNGKTATIKKGYEVFLPFGNIQNDPKYFKDPEKFDPERFSDENKRNIKSGTFMPFGLGPRNCIGSRYALLEAKLLVFSTLASFRVEKCNETPKKLIIGNGTTGFRDKILLSFCTRNRG